MFQPGLNPISYILTTRPIFIVVNMVEIFLTLDVWKNYTLTGFNLKLANPGKDKAADKNLSFRLVFSE